MLGGRLAAIIVIGGRGRAVFTDCTSFLRCVLGGCDKRGVYIFEYPPPPRQCYWHFTVSHSGASWTRVNDFLSKVYYSQLLRQFRVLFGQCRL